MYHSFDGILFDGILTGKRGWSITWERGGKDDRPSISLVSRRSHPSWISDENGKLNRRNAKEEYANILLDKCYLLYEEYLIEKKSVYIPKPCREIGQSLEESLGGKLVDWTIDMENYADPWGCYPPRRRPRVDNSFLDLHNSSHHTQPLSMIANYTVKPHEVFGITNDVLHPSNSKAYGREHWYKGTSL